MKRLIAGYCPAALMLSITLATPSFAAIEFGLEGEQNEEASQVEPGNEQAHPQMTMLIDTQNPNIGGGQTGGSTGPQFVKKNRTWTLGGGGGGFGGVGGANGGGGLGQTANGLGQLLAGLKDGSIGQLFINNGSILINNGKITLPTSVSLCDPDDEEESNGGTGGTNTTGQEGEEGSTTSEGTPEATTVPEPTSVLAWLALSGLGIGLTLVRRR